MAKNNLFILFLILLFSSCASHQIPLYKKGVVQDHFPDGKKIDKRFILMGDAGNSEMGKSTAGLLSLNTYLKSQARKGDYTIFLGDNIYPEGLPKKDDKDRPLLEYRLDAQYNAVKERGGRVIFIPGNHDWYNDGVTGLKREQDYLEEMTGSTKIMKPEDGCPLWSHDINDNVHLIVIDTQWYLEDWDKNPTINDKCQIKTREKFFEELEGEIKKNQQKTIVIAMHHPMYTNGVHGGKFDLDKHLFPGQQKIPVPIFASLITEVRTQGGVSKQDRYNEKYNALMKRIAVLIGDDQDRAILASGHEHTLQYIEHAGVKQIVSGAGSKNSYVSLGGDGLFGYGNEGFAVLDIFKDGSSQVRFYAPDEANNPKLLFEKNIYGPEKHYDVDTLTTRFPKMVQASVYNFEETEKSALFKSLWGDHYRDVYGKKVTAPVALLDTLYGGLEVVRPGGGHQTVSLRLKTRDGKEYNMRALRKSALTYLQKVILKDKEGVKEDFKGTLPQSLIEDFYTSAQPYGAFAIPKLSDAARVLHTLPKLYYVPKQPALKGYNADYGDELYMIEERPAKEFNGAIFNYPDDVESMDDILDKIRSDEKNVVDEKAYVRARMFDMLIGDWDRHNDQWRWAEFKDQNGKDVYEPIPRDRDQVFTNFDGTIINIAKTLFGAAKQLQVYDEKLKDIKWFNNAGIKLDRALLQNSTRADWIEQATYIKDHVSDAVITAAFNDLPVEVRNASSIDEIKKNLRGRRDNLVDIANKYYDYFSNLQTITGTDKDDYFLITRLDNATRVQTWRIKGGQKADLMVDRTFLSKDTQELWIYGLDDDDVFEVKGNGKKPIFTRIIGGQNNDIYKIANGDKIKVYDNRSLPNTIKEKGGAYFRLTDIYDYNTYDYTKQILRNNLITPAVGYNPDDGISLGLRDVYTVNGFQQNPFSQQHRFKVGFFFATQGLDVNYEGEFAGLFNDWNLLLTGRYTTPTFSQNFFGLGNETPNFDEELGKNYNRIRMSRIEASAGVLKNSDYGSTFKVRALFQSIDVDDNDGRILDDIDIIEQDTHKVFGTLEAAYEYHSADNPLVPTRGMDFDLTGGITQNFGSADRRFAYLDPSLGFYNAISRNRKLVLKTTARAAFRFGEDYEFYQAATLGQDNGLRGYRFNRFSGGTALSGSGDLRYAFNSFRTPLLPLQLGVLAGYDIGRVFVENGDSKVWHDSYGVGLWVNSADALQGTINLFDSDDGWRFSFGFGFNF